MLTKTLLLLAATATLADAGSPQRNLAYRKSLRAAKEQKDRRRAKERSHPQVQFDPSGGYEATCELFYNALKEGPPDIKSIIASGAQYVDTDFGADINTIGFEDWEYEEPAEGIRDLEKSLKECWYEWDDDENDYDYDTCWRNSWENWQTFTVDKTIFDGETKLDQVVQGEIGSCYTMAPMNAVADHDDLVKDLFVTKEENDAGIHAVKMYVRGKPWVVAVDDRILYTTEDATMDAKDLPFAYFTRASKGGAMWAAILEKALAKIKGSYYNIEYGFHSNGLRALFGVPIIQTDVSDWCLETDTEMFQAIKDGLDRGYAYSANTSGSNDTTPNHCGLSAGHVYSFHDAFVLNNGKYDTNMYMIRDPYGAGRYQDYFKQWRPTDSKRWTDIAIQAVKDRTGFDPTKSLKSDGIFFMPDYQFKACFENIAQANRDIGFSDNWYDALDMDEEWHTYYIEIPEDYPDKSGDIYISVESYTEQYIDDSCVDEASIYDDGWTPDWFWNPLVMWSVYQQHTSQDNAESFSLKKDSRYHELEVYETFVAKEDSWQPGDVFAIDVRYWWYRRYGRDYTVKVYSKMDLEIVDQNGKTNQLHTDGQSPSEFTVSTYCGLDDCEPTTPYDKIDSEAYDGDKWYLTAEQPPDIEMKEQREKEDDLMNAEIEDDSLSECVNLHLGIGNIIVETEEEGDDQGEEDQEEGAGEGEGDVEGEEDQEEGDDEEEGDVEGEEDQEEGDSEVEGEVEGEEDQEEEDSEVEGEVEGEGDEEVEGEGDEEAEDEDDNEGEENPETEEGEEELDDGEEQNNDEPEDEEEENDQLSLCQEAVALNDRDAFAELQCEEIEDQLEFENRLTMEIYQELFPCSTDADCASNIEQNLVLDFYTTCANVFFADNDPKSEKNDGSDKHSYGTTINYFCIPEDACDQMHLLYTTDVQGNENTLDVVARCSDDYVYVIPDSDQEEDARKMIVSLIATVGMLIATAI